MKVPSGKLSVHPSSYPDRKTFLLKPLGILYGKPFKPNERQKKILTESALVGEEMAKANSFHKRFAGTYYRPDAHWKYVLMLDPFQRLASCNNLDERAA